MPYVGFRLRNVNDAPAILKSGFFFSRCGRFFSHLAWSLLTRAKAFPWYTPPAMSVCSRLTHVICHPRPCIFSSNSYECVGGDSYVELIRPRAESYGIAKIVPPAGWKPPATPMHLHATKRVPTKKQALHSLMNVGGCSCPPRGHCRRRVLMSVLL